MFQQRIQSKKETEKQKKGTLRGQLPSKGQVWRAQQSYEVKEEKSRKIVIKLPK